MPQNSMSVVALSSPNFLCFVALCLRLGFCVVRLASEVRESLTVFFSSLVGLIGFCLDIDGGRRGRRVRMAWWALDFVSNALTHDSAEVRAAACICIKSLSRSVKKNIIQYLSAGRFVNEFVITALVQLLHDTSASVQSISGLPAHSLEIST
ncbi:unnamed protein product [Ilex paraguariensis]|uniref:ARM repeat superfamily protein n=1 Tax=Ilex paraguariensis TaxID=185542 RepID=A0ABC8T9N1_9AQUA